MGRTRFQKMIFLLQATQTNAATKLDLGFRFIPYDYGPYSKTLQLDINGLIERGLLKEEPKINDFGKYMYKYEITDEGKMFIDSLLTEPKYCEYQFSEIYRLLMEIKNDVNDKDLDQLLHEIYADYPEYAQFSKYKF